MFWLLKKIIISLVIIFILNWIIHYFKNLYTKPIIKYIEPSQPYQATPISPPPPPPPPPQEPVKETSHPEEPDQDMKNELSMYLSSIQE